MVMNVWFEQTVLFCVVTFHGAFGMGWFDDTRAVKGMARVDGIWWFMVKREGKQHVRPACIWFVAA